MSASHYSKLSNQVMVFRSFRQTTLCDCHGALQNVGTNRQNSWPLGNSPIPGFPGSVPQGGTHGFGIRRVPLRGALPGQFLANYCGLFPASSFCFSNRLSSDLLFLFSLSCAFNCWKISKW